MYLEHKLGLMTVVALLSTPVLDKHPRLGWIWFVFVFVFFFFLWQEERKGKNSKPPIKVGRDLQLRQDVEAPKGRD